MRILHLSDTHLERTDAPNKYGVNATESLRLMLTELRHQRDVDAIVVSGDLANDGAVDAYTAVRELLRDFALTKNAPVVYSTGNHDERQAFAKVLGSGHLEADGTDRAEKVLASGDLERAAVSAIGGYRFVTLDSLVPGEVYGHLGEAQLDWLREVLRTPAPRGTVLVFHHPPITLDIEMQRAFGLRNPADLADAIRGTDVRVVLTGHFHLQMFGFLESTPVWVTPGVVNRIDLTTAPGTERAVRGASASLVELGGPSSPLFHTFHARDPRAHETVYELDEDQTRSFLERRRPRS
ncbi:metallophosphoesterase family protein [Streptomyces yaanensis]|uniref:Metallophosphoesterase family protein n=1 Tax=Streptomyces yaanensis TaxID=1142239 RepID=A0ABV7SA25_9ACTN|nr:metallophosphoesterase [Streptomyces sp. CGMCC 4.7035]WNC02629.1 metallophosphoesterase [Streptomyces sp. CGMCC 4.7035]